MNEKERKRRIFKIFSQNLEWVKEHRDIRFVPDFTDGYICPICFNTFFATDLDSAANNPLTLEHVPPASLGGKPLTLTCKSCNSKNGQDLDAHLVNALLDDDSMSFLPNSMSKASYEVGGSKVNGSFDINSDGTANLRIEPKISNPDQYKNFVEKMGQVTITKYNPFFHPDKMFQQEEYSTPKFQMRFRRVFDERKAEIALLRIAYLIAYANFGNGFLINQELFEIREQILNPDKKILPSVFWLKAKFPKEMEGLNIISYPKELHCFLIIFSLQTKSQSKQFAIALPGPSAPANKIYDFIETYLCVGDGSQLINFTVEHLPPRDYLKQKNNTFVCHQYWQKFTHPDYKADFINQD